MPPIRRALSRNGGEHLGALGDEQGRLDHQAAEGRRLVPAVERVRELREDRLEVLERLLGADVRPLARGDHRVDVRQQVGLVLLYDRAELRQQLGMYGSEASRPLTRRIAWIRSCSVRKRSAWSSDRAAVWIA